MYIIYPLVIYLTANNPHPNRRPVAAERRDAKGCSLKPEHRCITTMGPSGNNIWGFIGI